MRRKFEPFNSDVIRKEFFSLPATDATALRIAMAAYQMELGTGCVIKDYKDGLWMLKDASRVQGRCLFFRQEPHRLVVVLIYKKESDEAPLRVIDAARKRMEGI